MPESVSRSDTELVLGRMGYTLLRKEGAFSAFFHSGEAGGYLQVSFKDDKLLRDDLVRNLEYEGINPDVFHAELESL